MLSSKNEKDVLVEYGNFSTEKFPRFRRQSRLQSLHANILLVLHRDSCLRRFSSGIFSIFLLSIILLISLAFPVSAYQSPGKPSGFVNDFANVFSIDQKTSLEAKFSSLEKETSIEVSVVTIPLLGDETIETYSGKLFEEWSIGKANQDNGLLILVSPSDRQVRIEVGYGLEPVITDAVSSAIMRNVMIPAFKSNDYFRGINSATDLIIGLIKSDPETEQYIESNTENKRKVDVSELLFFVLIIAFQFIPVIIYSKSWWLGGVIGFLLGLLLFYSFIAGVIIAVIGLILDYFLSKKFGGKRPPGGHNGVWFGGFGGGRGSGGGGFGGFGGGSFGGGGSSGRW